MNQPGSHTAPAAPSGALSTASACLALALLALAAYWSSLGYGFLNLDDTIYVTQNPMVRDGFVDGSLRYAFSLNLGNWHPLTWLSLMLHAEIFGMTPLGLRIENLILHAASAVLVFLSLRVMTRRFWPCLLTAALFAVHPVNVENVAWIAEHKTLLASVFGFGAVYAHALYVRRPGPWRYALVSACALLSLLAKPVFVCLPALFLLLDAWPLGRFAPGRPVLPRLGRLLLEKTPLLLMAAGLCVAYILIARDHGAGYDTVGTPGMGLRVANALVSYVRYLAHLAWPLDLSFFYPFPGSIPMLQSWASALVLTAVTVLVLLARPRPWLAVGWLWFVVSLLPAMGIVQTGYWPAMAEHNLYLPAVGVFMAVAFSLSEAVDRRPRLRPWMTSAGALAVALLLAVCMVQVRYWRDDETLTRRALALNERNWFAHNLLGVALFQDQRIHLAESHFRRSLELYDGSMHAHANLAKTRAALGDFAEAAREYRRAIRLSPETWSYRKDLSVVLERGGSVDEAAQVLEDATLSAPNPAAVLTDLAELHMRHEQWAKALDVQQRLARDTPDDPMLLNNMGVALYRLKRYAQAEARFRETLDLDPAWVDPRVHLAGALFRQGRYDEAEAEVRRALATTPDHPGALKLLPMIEKTRP